MGAGFAYDPGLAVGAPDQQKLHAPVCFIHQVWPCFRKQIERTVPCERFLRPTGYRSDLRVSVLKVAHCFGDRSE